MNCINLIVFVLLLASPDSHSLQCPLLVLLVLFDERLIVCQKPD